MRAEEARGRQPRKKGWISQEEGLDLLGRVSFLGKHSVQLRRLPQLLRSGSSCW